MKPAITGRTLATTVAKPMAKAFQYRGLEFMGLTIQERLEEWFRLELHKVSESQMMVWAGSPGDQENLTSHRYRALANLNKLVQLESDYSRIYEKSRDYDPQDQLLDRPGLFGGLEGEISSELSLAGYTDEQVLVIIGSLSAQGYLPDPDQVRNHLNLRQEEMDEILRILEEVEPGGIGRRDFAGFALFTIKRWSNEQYLPVMSENEHSSLIRFFQDHHQDYISGHFDPGHIGLTPNRLEEILALLPGLGLTLGPLSGYGASSQTAGALPEIEVSWSSGELGILPLVDVYQVLNLNRNNIDYYTYAVEQCQSSRDLENLNNQFIAHRELLYFTLLRVNQLIRITRAIFDVQQRFFQEGLQGIKPLTCKELAEQTGLSPATISRITSQTWILCNERVLLLKNFLSVAVGSREGRRISRLHARDLVREWISEENPKSPLRDDQICEQFTQIGVQVTRRLIAKYRNELGLADFRKRTR